MIDKNVLSVMLMTMRCIVEIYQESNDYVYFYFVYFYLILITHLQLIINHMILLTRRYGFILMNIHLYSTNTYSLYSHWFNNEHVLLRRKLHDYQLKFRRINHFTHLEYFTNLKFVCTVTIYQLKIFVLLIN